MGDEIKEELGSMIDALSGIVKEPEPEPEPNPEPEPTPEPDPAPEPEPEPEPSPEPEPDEKDKIIEELRRKLEERETPAPTPKPEPPPEEPLTFEPTDFIGDLDPEDIMRDKDELNKLLNSVYSKGVTDARKLTSEKVLLSIPEIVRNNLNIMTELQKTSDEFYANNKDLAPFKKVVAAVFEEVAAKNPDKKYGELLNEVGDEARRRLELHKKVAPTPPAPRLPNKKGSPPANTNKPDTSSIQSEIELMNKSLGGK